MWTIWVMATTRVMPTRWTIAIGLACAGSILLGGIATAQTPAPATPAPVPEAMPFDIPYGTPIDLDMAQKAIAASAAEAKKHNWKMAIAVVGPAGQLIAHATMDGTQYTSIDIAQAKARSAACFAAQARLSPMSSTVADRPRSACWRSSTSWPPREASRSSSMAS